MPSVLNQEVEILGRVFHFQTELSARKDASIRTEVFVGGRIVATRETPLSSVEVSAAEQTTVRSKIQRQHQRIVRGFIERARSYQERVLAGQLPKPASDQLFGNLSQAAEAERSLRRQPAPPSRAAASAASKSLRLRRILGQFHRRIADVEHLAGDAPKRRLELAGTALTWLLNSQTFQDMRLDEQVRCHLLKQRLEQWLEGECDSAQASLVWSKVRAFDDYTAEINGRAELVAFDRQVLAWAIEQSRQNGMTDDILERVALLYGRDPGLDALLDQPGGVSTGKWLTCFRRVRASLSSTRAGQLLPTPSPATDSIETS